MARKIIGIACAVVMIISALTACATSVPTPAPTTAAPAATSAAPAETTAPAATATPEPSEPPQDTRQVVPITIMTLHSNYSDVDGMAADPVKAYIENKLKVKLNLVGGDNEKAKLMLTTGRAPDILSMFTWESGFTTLCNDSIAQGMVINMGYYTAKEPNRYPILSKVFADKDFQALCSLYGGDKTKCYVFLTMLSQLSTPSTPIFNLQYLKEAGIATLPTTVDEFVAALRALRAAKPDVITFGYLNYKGTSFPGELNELFFETRGTNAESIEEDPNNPGTFIDNTLNEKNIAVWQELGDLYKEGIFDPEAFSKEAYYMGTDDFATGKTAVITFACPNTNWTMYDWLWSCIVKNNPNAKPEDYPMLPQPLKGEYKIHPGVALSAGVVIPTTCQYPDRALDVLEYSLSNEGQAIDNCGIPDQTFTWGADGLPAMTDAQVAQWNKMSNVYKQGEGRWGVFEMMIYNGGCYVDYTKNNYVESYIKSVDLVTARKAKGSVSAAYAQPIVEAYQKTVNYSGDIGLKIYNVDNDTAALAQKMQDVKNKYFQMFFFDGVKVADKWAEFTKAYKDAGADTYLTAYTKAIADARALLK